ncbi:MAG: RagB/SusD family nutrient uptake outer membrane protein [Tannerellaceae bacterium]|nr:RagB/SusD family nutrient uptake outer membrane protein [Tannerellaceae bacterium]
MKTKLIKYTSVCLLVASYLLVGCVELEVTPNNKYSDETFWTSVERANALLSMGYNQMMNSDRIFRDERLSDNLYNGYGNPAERLIQTGIATTATGIFADEWKDSYGGIKTTHTFLANIDRLNADEALIERMKAEARFIRAFIYFRLTNWYGDIPFFKEDIDLETAQTISRTSQSTIVEFLHQELDDIAEILPASYSGSDKGRITSGAAVALNARIALNFNNWDKVIECTDKLINSTKYGDYDLFENYQELFFYDNQYNKEIILDIQYATTYRTWSNIFAYVPLSLEGTEYINASPTQDLVDSYLMLDGSKWNENQPMYDDRDPRLDMTIIRHGGVIKTKQGTSYTVNIDPNNNPNSNDYAGRQNGTQTGYFYHKYYDANPLAWTNNTSWSCNINIPTIRFADVLLMYAEAMYEKGQMNAEVWNKTIKRLRERAGFIASSALDFPGNTSDLQDIIRNERRVELALEGLRIFDIRRWNIAHIVLSKPFRGAKFDKNGTDYFEFPAGSFGTRDYLWPVPLQELQINPNLGQNTGY